ncbi:MAG: tRNA (cytosine(32)/uridine(32)-2'-O)-methyltransferase TrmJ [Xanthomonadaceae bacterium]|nr:tRNA (cytosine(32)/uridine(32)-2'-O)-methyltransferase TrmJ [Xanthomonadaceae bacterium]
MLDNIRIVLVNTSHPGNIGASARAMKTMGLAQLYLVQPRDYPNAEATARASGADDLLARAVVCDDLDSALAGCRWVVGASARLRTIAVPLLLPRDCAGQARQECEQGEVALLFGREQSGLSNEELDRCHALVHIPTDAAYGSLNLAMAVQVLAYELRMAHLDDDWQPPPEIGEHTPLAEVDEVERFYAHLEQALTELEFLDPANPRQLMRRLRRLFNRVRLDRNEVNILRGILSAAQQAKGGGRP